MDNYKILSASVETNLLATFKGMTPKNQRSKIINELIRKYVEDKKPKEIPFEAEPETIIEPEFTPSIA